MNKESPVAMMEQSLEEMVYNRLSTAFFKLLQGGADQTRGLYPMIMAQMERPLIKLVLEACEGNKCEAARMLGLNRNTLLKKMRYLGMPTQPRFWRKKR